MPETKKSEETLIIYEVVMNNCNRIWKIVRINPKLQFENRESSCDDIYFPHRQKQHGKTEFCCVFLKSVYRRW